MNDQSLSNFETEGSHFDPTDYPIGLISLSPKFSNSRTLVWVLLLPIKLLMKGVAQHESLGSIMKL